MSAKESAEALSVNQKKKSHKMTKDTETLQAQPRSSKDFASMTKSEKTTKGCSIEQNTDSDSDIVIETDDESDSDADWRVQKGELKAGPASLAEHLHSSAPVIMEEAKRRGQKRGSSRGRKFSRLVKKAKVSFRPATRADTKNMRLPKEPEAANEKNSDSDSEWESVSEAEGSNEGHSFLDDDDDDSEEGVLMIDVDGKEEKLQESQIPLQEQLEETITSGSARNNLSVSNVKNIIWTVLTHDLVKEMLKTRLRACADEEGQVFEPKLTRSKMKEVLENDAINWPVSPSKLAHPATAGPSILDMEFEEDEEEDAEYEPSKDADAESDEESVASSQVSDIGSPFPVSSPRPATPSTPGVSVPAPPTPFPGPSGVLTQPCAHSSMHSSPSQQAGQAQGEVNSMGPPVGLPPMAQSAKQRLVFRSPKKQAQEQTEENGIAARTRSKLPLTTTSLYDIEEAFVAPDITPDMYDTTCDDTDWQDFLKSLQKFGDGESQEQGEEDDPEFNYTAEVQDIEPDVEEACFGGSYRVSRKELNGLMEELEDLFNGDDYSMIGLRTNLASAHSNAALLAKKPGATSSDHHGHSGEGQRQPPTHKHGHGSKDLRALEEGEEREEEDQPTADTDAPQAGVSHDAGGSAVEEGSSGMSLEARVSSAMALKDHYPILLEPQLRLIEEHMRKHVQLTTQMFVLTKGSEDFFPQADTCKKMLCELDVLLKNSPVSSQSAFNACNLPGALEVVNRDIDWVHHLRQRQQREKQTRRKVPPSPLPSAACSVTATQEGGTEAVGEDRETVTETTESETIAGHQESTEMSPLDNAESDSGVVAVADNLNPAQELDDAGQNTGRVSSVEDVADSVGQSQEQGVQPVASQCLGKRRGAGAAKKPSKKKSGCSGAALLNPPCRSQKRLLGIQEEILWSSSVFLYPSLLPSLGLIPRHILEQRGRFYFCPAEDNLLVLGKHQFSGLGLKGWNVYKLIHHYMMPCKTEHKLRAHFNEKFSNKNHTILRYKETGELPEGAGSAEEFSLDMMKAPCDQPLSALPSWCRRRQKMEEKKKEVMQMKNQLGLREDACLVTWTHQEESRLREQKIKRLKSASDQGVATEEEGAENHQDLSCLSSEPLAKKRRVETGAQSEPVAEAVYADQRISMQCEQLIPQVSLQCEQPDQSVISQPVTSQPVTIQPQPVNVNQQERPDPPLSTLSQPSHTEGVEGCTLDTSDDPLTHKTSDDQPLTHKTSDDQPLTHKTSDDQPQIYKTSDDQPLTHKTSGDPPLTTLSQPSHTEGVEGCTLDTSDDQPLTHKTSDDQPLTHKTSDDTPLTHKTFDDQPQIYKTSDDQPLTLKTSDDQPLTHKTSDDPPLTHKTSDDPPLTILSQPSATERGQTLETSHGMYVFLSPGDVDDRLRQALAGGQALVVSNSGQQKTVHLDDFLQGMDGSHTELFSTLTSLQGLAGSSSETPSAALTTHHEAGDQSEQAHHGSPACSQHVDQIQESFNVNSELSETEKIDHLQDGFSVNSECSETEQTDHLQDGFSVSSDCSELEQADHSQDGFSVNSECSETEQIDHSQDGFSVNSENSETEKIYHSQDGFSVNSECSETEQIDHSQDGFSVNSECSETEQIDLSQDGLSVNSGNSETEQINQFQEGFSVDSRHSGTKNKDQSQDAFSLKSECSETEQTDQLQEGSSVDSECSETCVQVRECDESAEQRQGMLSVNPQCSSAASAHAHVEEETHAQSSSVAGQGSPQSETSDNEMNVNGIEARQKLTHHLVGSECNGQKQVDDKGTENSDNASGSALRPPVPAEDTDSRPSLSRQQVLCVQDGDDLSAAEQSCVNSETASEHNSHNIADRNLQDKSPVSANSSPSKTVVVYFVHIRMNCNHITQFIDYVPSARKYGALESLSQDKKFKQDNNSLLQGVMKEALGYSATDCWIDRHRLQQDQPLKFSSEKPSFHKWTQPGLFVTLIVSMMYSADYSDAENAEDTAESPSSTTPDRDGQNSGQGQTSNQGETSSQGETSQQGQSCLPQASNDCDSTTSDFTGQLGERSTQPSSLLTLNADRRDSPHLSTTSSSVVVCADSSGVPSHPVSQAEAQGGGVGSAVSDMSVSVSSADGRLLSAAALSMRAEEASVSSSSLIRRSRRRRGIYPDLSPDLSPDPLPGSEVSSSGRGQPNYEMSIDVGLSLQASGTAPTTASSLQYPATSQGIHTQAYHASPPQHAQATYQAVADTSSSDSERSSSFIAAGAVEPGPSCRVNSSSPVWGIPPVSVGPGTSAGGLGEGCGEVPASDSSAPGQGYAAHVAPPLQAGDSCAVSGLSAVSSSNLASECMDSAQAPVTEPAGLQSLPPREEETSSTCEPSTSSHTAVLECNAGTGDTSDDAMISDATLTSDEAIMEMERSASPHRPASPERVDCPQKGAAKHSELSAMQSINERSPPPPVRRSMSTSREECSERQQCPQMSGSAGAAHPHPHQPVFLSSLGLVSTRTEDDALALRSMIQNLSGIRVPSATLTSADFTSTSERSPRKFLKGKSPSETVKSPGKPLPSSSGLRTLAPKPGPVSYPSPPSLPHRGSPKKQLLQKHVRAILPKGYNYELKMTSPTKAAARTLKKKATLFCQRSPSKRLMPREPKAEGKPPSHPKLSLLVQQKRGRPSLSKSRDKLEAKKRRKKNPLILPKPEPHPHPHPASATTVTAAAAKGKAPSGSHVKGQTGEVDKGGHEESDETGSEMEDVAMMSQDDSQNEEEVGDDDSYMQSLMAASTTIGFNPYIKTTPDKEDHCSIQERRRRYKLSLLAPDILETDPRKDDRDMAFAQLYLNKVKVAMTMQKDVSTYTQFMDILRQFETSQASPVEVYESVCGLLASYPDLLEEFSAFLQPGQALQNRCHVPNQMIHTTRTFLRKLEMIYRHKGGRYHKIARTLTKYDPKLVSPCVLHKQLLNLMGTVPRHIHDEIAYLFPDAKPPESHMESEDFEDIVLRDSDDDDGNRSPDDFEDLTLPEENDPYRTRRCPCACHKAAFKRKKKEKYTHCYNCCLKVVKGHLYFQPSNVTTRRLVSATFYDPVPMPLPPDLPPPSARSRGTFHRSAILDEGDEDDLDDEMEEEDIHIYTEDDKDEKPDTDDFDDEEDDDDDGDVDDDDDEEDDVEEVEDEEVEDEEVEEEEEECSPRKQPRMTPVKEAASAGSLLRVAMTSSKEVSQPLSSVESGARLSSPHHLSSSPQQLPSPTTSHKSANPPPPPPPQQQSTVQQQAADKTLSESAVCQKTAGQQLPQSVGQQSAGQQEQGQCSASQPLLQQLLGQQPVPQQLLGQQPVPQQLLGQHTVPQQLLGQQPVPQQLLGQQPAPQQLLGQQPVPQQLLGQKPVPQQLLGQQTVPQQLLGQQPVPQQLLTQQTVPQQLLSQPLVAAGVGVPPQQQPQHLSVEEGLSLLTGRRPSSPQTLPPAAVEKMSMPKPGQSNLRMRKRILSMKPGRQVSSSMQTLAPKPGLMPEGDTTNTGDAGSSSAPISPSVMSGAGPSTWITPRVKTLGTVSVVGPDNTVIMFNPTLATPPALGGDPLTTQPSPFFPLSSAEGGGGVGKVGGEEKQEEENSPLPTITSPYKNMEKGSFAGLLQGLQAVPGSGSDLPASTSSSALSTEPACGSMGKQSVAQSALQRCDSANTTTSTFTPSSTGVAGATGVTGVAGPLLSEDSLSAMFGHMQQGSSQAGVSTVSMDMGNSSSSTSLLTRLMYPEGLPATQQEGAGVDAAHVPTSAPLSLEVSTLSESSSSSSSSSPSPTWGQRRLSGQSCGQPRVLWTREQDNVIVEMVRSGGVSAEACELIAGRLQGVTAHQVSERVTTLVQLLDLSEEVAPEKKD